MQLDQPREKAARGERMHEGMAPARVLKLLADQFPAEARYFVASLLEALDLKADMVQSRSTLLQDTRELRAFSKWPDDLEPQTVGMEVVGGEHTLTVYFFRKSRFKTEYRQGFSKLVRRGCRPGNMFQTLDFYAQAVLPLE